MNSRTTTYLGHVSNDDSDADVMGKCQLDMTLGEVHNYYRAIEGVWNYWAIEYDNMLMQV